MANFAEFSDDGFQGRIFPYQRAKLREYFCLNPWPDAEFVTKIAVEVGVPEFVISNYFNFVRGNHEHYSSVATSSQPKPDKELSADTIHKLNQYRIQLPTKPSVQAIDNIARELNISKVTVAKFFHEYTTTEDDIDSILDEMLEYPSKEDKGAVNDVHLSDVDETILPPTTRECGQDELMLALSEVGLSTGQMTKFCSDTDIFQVPEHDLPDFSSMSTHQSTAKNKHSRIVYTNNMNYPGGVGLNQNQSDFQLASRFYNAPDPDLTKNFNQKPVVIPPSENTGSSLFMAPYKVISYSPTQVMVPSTKSDMFALSSVHCTAVSGSRSNGEYIKNVSSNTYDVFSDSFTEYELMKDETNDRQPALFHRYMKQKSSSNTTRQDSSMKSDPILITSSDDEGLTNLRCSNIQQNVNRSIDLGVPPLPIMITQSNGPNKPTRGKRKPRPRPVSPLGQGQVPRKRNMRCKECSPCRAPDCGECMYCLDKPKFGGPNRRKNACVHRKCTTMVGRRRRTKSSLLSDISIISSPEIVTSALTNIPLDVEGHEYGGMGMDYNVVDHNLIETRCPSNFNSTPVKRRVSNLDDFDYMDMDSGELEDAPSKTAVNIENRLYGQYLDAMVEGDGHKYQKFDETVKKIRKNFYETEKGKFLLKEKLVAVEMDHSYAGGDGQCFDGMNSDIGKLVESNKFENKNYESSDIGDIYDENKKENHENKGCYDGSHVVGDSIDNNGCVDEEKEINVFDESTVRLEMDDEPLNIVVCDYSTGDVDDSDVEHKEGVRDVKLPTSRASEGDDTEDQSTDEYYAKLDSSDKKEIQKQLTEDFKESYHMISSDEAKDISLDSSDPKTVVDANNHLLLECVEDVVIKPSCNAHETASNVGELEESNEDYHSRLSSLSSTDEYNCSSPSVGMKVVTVEYLVSQSEYFKTRPSMLKKWRSNDLTLEEDSSLPQGWKIKVYTRKSGRVDIHYITPENLDIRSKFGVLEYMRLSENYDEEELDRVANNLRPDVR